MHVVMVVVMMVMMVMMVMVVVHGRFGGHRRLARRGAGDRFLGEGVPREADREGGRDDKALDHGLTFLIEDPFGLRGLTLRRFA